MAARLPKFSLGEGPDRVFNLVAIGLAALLIVGLCGLGAWALFLRPKGPTVPAATPEGTLIAQLTPLATWTFTPTFTPVRVTPSPTPTNTPVLQPTTPSAAAEMETPTPTSAPTPAETPPEARQTTPQTGLGFPILVAGLALAIFILIIRRLRTA